MYAESEVRALVIGNVVATLRKRRALTQADLARRIRISQPQLSRIERGDAIPDDVTFDGLARALGTTSAAMRAQVVAAEQKTRAAADAAVPNAGTAPWWAPVLAVVGIVGLAGLVVFAVAAVLGAGGEDDKA